MKLLGWMHHKLHQISCEPLKNYATGKQSLDDEQYISKPNFKPFKQPKRDQYHRKTFAGFKAGRVADEYEKDTSSLISDFHGLLAIGTLGSAEVSSDIKKPKISLSLDDITEKEKEVSENEMKIEDIELEKELAAQSKIDGLNRSSHTNRQASMGRTSHASTINFSSKPTDSHRSTTNGTLVCQFREYLFGKAAEVSETKCEEKEIRTSPGVLFQNCKLNSSGAKCNKDEKHADKEVDKSALYLMTKKLKKKMLPASSGNLEVVAPVTLDSASAGKKKLHKMLTMFHRKVQPENSITIETLDKPQKNENWTKATHDESCDIKDRTVADEDMMLYSKMAFSNHTFYKTANPKHFTLPNSDSNGNKERWIRTDADYLVLELSEADEATVFNDQ